MGLSRTAQKVTHYSCLHPNGETGDLEISRIHGSDAYFNQEKNKRNSKFNDSNHEIFPLYTARAAVTLAYTEG